MRTKVYVYKDTNGYKLARLKSLKTVLEIFRNFIYDRAILRIGDEEF